MNTVLSMLKPLIFLLIVTLSINLSLAYVKRIDKIGTSGGTGPIGGIGSVSNPLKKAHCYITDAYLFANPKDGRKLSNCKKPQMLKKHPEKSQAAENYYKIIVDSTDAGERQSIIGFGHAWTDASVYVLNKLNPDVLEKAMQDLFGQTGNNMGFMRHTIGSSDLSHYQYSYNDNGPSCNKGIPDPHLSNFTLGEYGLSMVKMLQKMNKYKSDITLIGSPWSAPGWMKQNGYFFNNGDTYSTDSNSFDNKYITEYTNYLVKYVDEFRKHGVTVNAITPQNEPLNNQVGYPCMYLNASDQAKLVSGDLGIKMKQRGVGIWAYDHNTDNTEYPQTVLRDGNGHVTGVAWHCYQDPYANYTVIRDFHREYPDIPHFMTECSNYDPKINSVNFAVADSFMGPIKNGASGASMWVMATDEYFGPHTAGGGCDKCSGSLIIKGSMKYKKTADYYMIGQFSRFIRRGAVNHHIIRGDNGEPGDENQFQVLAARNPDSSWAIVFQNKGSREHNVVLEFSKDGDLWSGIVPGNTVVTWTLPGDKIR